MLYSAGNCAVRIRTVLMLEWERNSAYIPPRQYNALSFRLKGNSEFIVGNQRIRAEDQDILFGPPDCAYTVEAGEERLVVVHFETAENFSGMLQVLRPENPQQIEELFLSLLKTWEEKKPGFYPRAMSIFYKILELVVKQTSKGTHSPHYEKIREAVEYMMNNYRNSDLSVEDLCKRCAISDTYFRKCFLDEFHMTPNKYLTNLRIDYARDLLESGVYNIEQVAERSGFIEPKYFCTVFKKIVGKTPSEYKKHIPSARSDEAERG